MRNPTPDARLLAVATSRTVVAWSTVALTGLLLQPPTIAQQNRGAGTPIDISRLGPQVGQLVPDFNLKDQSGKSWTRQSILGPKGAMLVFFRSADW